MLTVEMNGNHEIVKLSGDPDDIISFMKKVGIDHRNTTDIDEINMILSKYGYAHYSNHE